MLFGHLMALKKKNKKTKTLELPPAIFILLLLALHSWFSTLLTLKPPQWLASTPCFPPCSLSPWLTHGVQSVLCWSGVAGRQHSSRCRLWPWGPHSLAPPPCTLLTQRCYLYCLPISTSMATTHQDAQCAPHTSHTVQFRFFFFVFVLCMCVCVFVSATFLLFHSKIHSHTFTVPF